MYDSTINSASDQPASRSSFKWFDSVRLTLGTILIIAGIALAVWLAITIYGLIWGDGAPAVVTNLTPQSQEDVAIIFPDGEYILAYKVFPVIAYVLTIFLLMVGVALVKAMLAGGSALLPQSATLPPPVKTPAQHDDESATLEAYYNREPL